MNNFGLSDKVKEAILAILRQHSTIEKAMIFGSRARNAYKVGSDVDLAVWFDEINNEKRSCLHEIASLKSDFEESNIPYFFDIVDYKHTTNDKLRQEIDKDGKDFYIKGSASSN